MRTLHQWGWVLGLFFLSLTSVVNGELLEPDEPEDLMTLSLEDLMQQKITSVSRKPQRLSHAAAAVFVITAEDIHRSGALTIADALRMAPGLDVARIDASKWAISSRGFNNRFANKILVLIDGRTVYTHMRQLKPNHSDITDSPRLTVGD